MDKKIGTATEHQSTDSETKIEYQPLYPFFKENRDTGNHAKEVDETCFKQRDSGCSRSWDLWTSSVVSELEIGKELPLFLSHCADEQGKRINRLLVDEAKRYEAWAQEYYNVQNLVVNELIGWGGKETRTNLERVLEGNYQRLQKEDKQRVEEERRVAKKEQEKKIQDKAEQQQMCKQQKEERRLKRCDEINRIVKAMLIKKCEKMQQRKKDILAECREISCLLVDSACLKYDIKAKSNRPLIHVKKFLSLQGLSCDNAQAQFCSSDKRILQMPVPLAFHHRLCLETALKQMITKTNMNLEVASIAFVKCQCFEQYLRDVQYTGRWALGTQGSETTDQFMAILEAAFENWMAVTKSSNRPDPWHPQPWLSCAAFEDFQLFDSQLRLLESREKIAEMPQERKECDRRGNCIPSPVWLLALQKNAYSNEFTGSFQTIFKVLTEEPIHKHLLGESGKGLVDKALCTAVTSEILRLRELYQVHVKQLQEAFLDTETILLRGLYVFQSDLKTAQRLCRDFNLGMLRMNKSETMAVPSNTGASITRLVSRVLREVIELETRLLHDNFEKARRLREERWRGLLEPELIWYLFRCIKGGGTPCQDSVGWLSKANLECFVRTTESVGKSEESLKNEVKQLMQTFTLVEDGMIVFDTFKDYFKGHSRDQLLDFVSEFEAAVVKQSRGWLLCIPESELQASPLLPYLLSQVLRRPCCDATCADDCQAVNQAPFTLAEAIPTFYDCFNEDIEAEKVADQIQSSILATHPAVLQYNTYAELENHPLIQQISPYKRTPPQGSLRRNSCSDLQSSVSEFLASESRMSTLSITFLHAQAAEVECRASGSKLFYHCMDTSVAEPAALAAEHLQALIVPLRKEVEFRLLQRLEARAHHVAKTFLLTCLMRTSELVSNPETSCHIESLRVTHLVALIKKLSDVCELEYPIEQHIESTTSAMLVAHFISTASNSFTGSKVTATKIAEQIAQVSDAFAEKLLRFHDFLSTFRGKAWRLLFLLLQEASSKADVLTVFKESFSQFLKAIGMDPLSFVKDAPNVAEDDIRFEASILNEYVGLLERVFETIQLSQEEQKKSTKPEASTEGEFLDEFKKQMSMRWPRRSETNSTKKQAVDEAECTNCEPIDEIPIAPRSLLQRVSMLMYRRAVVLHHVFQRLRQSTEHIYRQLTFLIAESKKRSNRLLQTILQALENDEKTLWENVNLLGEDDRRNAGERQEFLSILNQDHKAKWQVKVDDYRQCTLTYLNNELVVEILHSGCSLLLFLLAGIIVTEACCQSDLSDSMKNSKQSADRIDVWKEIGEHVQKMKGNLGVDDPTGEKKLSSDCVLAERQRHIGVAFSGCIEELINNLEEHQPRSDSSLPASDTDVSTQILEKQVQTSNGLLKQMCFPILKRLDDMVFSRMPRAAESQLSFLVLPLSILGVADDLFHGFSKAACELEIQFKRLQDRVENGAQHVQDFVSEALFSEADSTKTKKQSKGQR